MQIPAKISQHDIYFYSTFFENIQLTKIMQFIMWKKDKIY